MTKKLNGETNNKSKRELLPEFNFIITIIITIIFGLKQCELQTEISQKDFNNGKYQMISLVSRFAVISLNRWDFIKLKTLANDNIKTDSVSIQQYITESEYILKSIRNLESNPFFVTLIESYPDINLMILQFQQDIIENKMGNYKFGINTFKEFYKLFLFLKNKYKDDVFDTNYFKHVEQSFDLINSGIKL